jgi:hypothetical protein
MSTRALAYTLVHRRGSRAFFLARSAQRCNGVREPGTAVGGLLQARGRVLRELARAALALAGVIGWGAVALLLAG